MPLFQSRVLTLTAAALSLIGGIPVPARANAPAPTPLAAATPDSDWVLSFDDEFGLSSVDQSKWLVTNGTYEQREDVRQYYTPLEVSVHDGSLFIVTEQKAMGGRTYMSGDLRTIGKFAQLYGKFEMRAREPRGIGAWPAFWLLPAANTWPPEIDIAESMGAAANQLFDSNHWGSTMATHGNNWFGWKTPTFDITAWHTYSVEWGPGTCTWFVDDQRAYTKPAAEPVSAVPMFMRLNTAVGPIAGNPDNGVWPQTFQVDWVRAYRLKGTPPPVCAGPNRVVSFPATSTELDGYSCNPLGSVQLTWTKTAGPGNSIFRDPNSAATNVTFDKPGEYHLRLTAKDGDLSAFDETTVFVDGNRDIERPAMQCALPSPVAAPVASVTAPPIAPPGPANLTALEMTLQAKPKSAAGEPVTAKLYLKFDLTHADGTKSAHLRFMCGIAPDGTDGSVTFGVYAVAGDGGWRETALTVANDPAVENAVANVTIAPDTWRGLAVWHDVDVTDYVKSAIRSHREFVTLCIAPIDATRDYDVTFKSRMATGSEPALILSGAAAAPPSMQGSRDWVPTFDDEFGGKSVDQDKWLLSTRADGTQWPVHYTPAAASVADGVLSLTSSRNADGSYSSAELLSQGRFSQRYGRFEIKAKIGSTAGSWSMADLLPDSATWPPGIDLYGHIGRMPNVVGLTSSWGQSAADDHFDYWLLGRPGFDPADWHVYALEWSPDALRWYVDGLLVHTKTGEPIPSDPMFLKVASMVGGDYPGDPSSGTWPQTYQIGYVRVFRAAGDHDGIQTPVVSGAIVVSPKAGQADGSKFTAYVKYDISTLPKQATVKLHLFSGATGLATSPTTPQWTIYDVPNTDFSADTLSGNTAPGVGRQIPLLLPAAPTTDCTDVDVTGQVNAARKHRAKFLAFAIASDDGSGASAYWSDAKMATTHEPTLTWSVGSSGR